MINNVIAILIIACISLPLKASEQTLEQALGQTHIAIQVTIPEVDSTPYHRPYVAVWLENTQRKGLHTFAFWREQEDWFKDLRQWWRKIGRKHSPNYDGVSGATRKPSTYELNWDGILTTGKTLPEGEYVLHFESVREQGSREYLRQKIQIKNKVTQHYSIQGQREIGLVTIRIN